VRVSQGALSVEFLTANLSSVLSDQDELLIIKNEAERMGIHILPPDVNASEEECCIDNGTIRLGLGTIKNVGKAAESILEARAKKGRFESLFDMCASVDLRLVNKKCLESLVLRRRTRRPQGHTCFTFCVHRQSDRLRQQFPEGPPVRPGQASLTSVRRRPLLRPFPNRSLPTCPVGVQ